MQPSIWKTVNLDSWLSAIALKSYLYAFLQTDVFFHIVCVEMPSFLNMATYSAVFFISDFILQNQKLTWSHLRSWLFKTIFLFQTFLPVFTNAMDIS